MSANTTANETQLSNCLSPSNPTAEKIGKTFLYCVLTVVSLAGNSFIGIVVYKTKAMRKPINFLIVNMAMSDLLYPFVLYPWILTDLYSDSWLIGGPLGHALCKLSPFLTDVSTIVSVLSLVLITVDRFGAVVVPLRSPLISPKLCPFFILATWIVSMAIPSPHLFASNRFEHSGGLVCAPQWHETFGESFFVNYFLAIIVIFFYIPLVLIAILYIIVVLMLKSQKTPGEQSVNAEQQRAKRERNVLKMAIAIVLVFAVCWLPASIGWILSFFASDMTSSCGFRYFFIVSVFMARANCAINPYICFIFSENYRQGLKNLLRCFSALQSHNQVARNVKREACGS